MDKILHFAWDVIKMCLFFILYMILEFFWSGILTGPKSMHTLFWWAYLIGAIGLIAFFIWRYREELKKHNPRGFGRHKLKKRNFWFMVLMIIVMFIVQYINVYLTVKGIIKIPENQASVNATLTQNFIASGLMVAIFGPFIEELIFRGFFFNYFFTKPSKLNDWLGIFFSGMIFGLAHDFSFSINALIYMIMGWILAGTYLFTRDIRYNIGLHMINNIFSLI